MVWFLAFVFPWTTAWSGGASLLLRCRWINTGYANEAGIGLKDSAISTFIPTQRWISGWFSQLTLSRQRDGVSKESVTTATAVFPAHPGFLFKGPFSGALAFLQPVIYSGVCSLTHANCTNPICPATTQQHHHSTQSRCALISSLRLTERFSCLVTIDKHATVSRVVL